MMSGWVMERGCGEFSNFQYVCLYKSRPGHLYTKAVQSQIKRHSQFLYMVKYYLQRTSGLIVTLNPNPRDMHPEETKISIITL